MCNQVRIESEWIPREANLQADFISCFVDSNDWTLHPDLFEKLDTKWGPHTVASYFNTQLNLGFNSQFCNPVSEAVDTLTCNWEGENNWWYQLVYLVPRAIRLAQETAASGTLVVPKWPSAPYWPMLFPGEGMTLPGVVSVMCIDKSEVINFVLADLGGIFSMEH